MTERIEPSSSWNLPATPKQIRAITRIASRLGFKDYVEETPRTRKEARDLLAGLREEEKNRRIKNGQNSNRNA